MELRPRLRKRKLSECQDTKPIVYKLNIDTISYCTIPDIKHLIKPEFINEMPTLEKSACQVNQINNDLLQKQPDEVFLNDKEKVQCDKCLNSFTKLGLIRHSCGYYTCKFCEKQFANRSKFDSHLRQHARIKERKSLKGTQVCEICRNIVRACYMRRHMNNHNKQWTCKICNQTMSADFRNSHKTSHHIYVCDVCRKVSKYKVNHIRHMEMHEKEKNYPCSECDASFQYLVELVRHITISHRHIEPGKFECLFCKKIVSAIGHHLRTHENNPTQCEKCLAMLPNYSAYKSHIRYHDIIKKSGIDRVITPRHLVARRTEPVQCGLCSKTFVHKHQLINHSKQHIMLVNYPCPYCDLSDFCSFAKLVQHVSLVHRCIPESHVQCPICVQIVPDIDSHMTIHKPDPYQCEVCDISFNTLKLYTKHYRKTHKSSQTVMNGISVFMKKYAIKKLNCRKVRCLHCNRPIRISHMIKHMESHQMFKCVMCQKEFFDRKLLEKHEAAHQSFSQRCPVCSQSFCSHVRLIAHLKMYHKMAFSASKACLRCYIN